MHLHRVRVDPIVMTLKENSTFSKAPRQEPHHHNFISWTFVGGEFYPSVKTPSVYFTAPTDLASVNCLAD